MQIMNYLLLNINKNNIKVIFIKWNIMYIKISIFLCPKKNIANRNNNNRVSIINIIIR